MSSLSLYTLSLYMDTEEVMKVMAMEASLADTEASLAVTATAMEARVAREDITLALSQLTPIPSLSLNHIIPLDTGHMSQHLIRNQSLTSKCLSHTVRVERVPRDMDTDMMRDTDTEAMVRDTAMEESLAREARENTTTLSHRRLSPSLRNQDTGVTSLLTPLIQIMNSIILFPTLSLCPSQSLNLSPSLNLCTMASLERVPRDTDTDTEMERDITDTDTMDTNTVASLAREAREVDITLVLLDLRLSHPRLSRSRSLYMDATRSPSLSPCHTIPSPCLSHMARAERVVDTEEEITAMDMVAREAREDITSQCQSLSHTLNLSHTTPNLSHTGIIPVLMTPNPLDTGIIPVLMTPSLSLCTLSLSHTPSRSLNPSQCTMARAERVDMEAIMVTDMDLREASQCQNQSLSQSHTPSLSLTGLNLSRNGLSPSLSLYTLSLNHTRSRSRSQNPMERVERDHTLGGIKLL